MMAQSVTIPSPPEDGLGTLPPPEGYPSAYCPAIREGKVINGKMPEGYAAPGADGAAQAGQIPSNEPLSLEDQLNAAMRQ